jgi:carboxypeptidase Taq
MPPATPASAAYSELCTRAREAATVSSIGSLLGWDQETYMPEAAADHRAQQLAFIAQLAHAKSTDPRIGELLSACEADAELLQDADAAANIREMRRAYDRATRLPSQLVADLARETSKAQQVWKDARQKSDFKRFIPALECVMDLTRQKARCYGTPEGGELYDALLDEYEPGMRAATVESIFTPLRQRLAALVSDLNSRGRAPSTRILTAKIPADRQHAFGQFILRSMGFDLRAGRLDTTAHPFCSGMAPGDTRLTTRYRDEKFTDALYGTMHEMGHGLYEQGLPKAERFGQPLADAVSLGIHESQSRLWENLVGRSREFWVWALPHARKQLGGPLARATVDQLYRAVNTATPSLIRVEADEATYNLHVMIRFEIERRILAGDLPITRIPEVWNRLYREFLGLTVPNDRLGCLQDVHWSFGLIGYFPTYTLGNLYAAQFWEKINDDIPDLKRQISRGRFADLLTWLRTNIHRHGMRYRAAELCERATGQPLSPAPLLRHLEGRLRPIYGVAAPARPAPAKPARGARRSATPAPARTPARRSLARAGAR